ncbi:MAG: beta-L-arabinofuranosidase domain-containing protein, partial [Bacteroidota bacterium]
TGKQAYQDYATYLYRAFSAYSINRSFNDLRYPYLKERDSLFEGHGVHTYEHIRTMVNAYYNTGYPELEHAYNNMLHKLDPCLLPSGAGHADEWILKLNADPNSTAAEYCGMLELRNSYGSLLQKTGNVAFADAAEKLTFNAMLGARNSDGTALTYSKFDNCHVLDGKHHEDGESREEPRYKYSPTHSEPAVCCVPNYTRNLTYFLEQMWMKAPDGVVATLFGPSKLTTLIDGVEVSIEEVTNYPLSDAISFVFTTEQPVEFTFYLRKPEWSNAVQSNVELQLLDNGFYAVTKEWSNGETISISFDNEIQMKTVGNDEVYYQKGPLVYAYEIPHTEQTIKSYGTSGFTDYYCLPKSESYKDLKIKDSNLSIAEDPEAKGFYDSELALRGVFTDSDNKDINVQLVPMGKTVLRRVTFPKSK